jgi:ribonuclease VapC
VTAAVLDCSAVLALLLGEKGADEVRDLIANSATSAINFAEAASYFSKNGATRDSIAAMLNARPFDVVDADRQLSIEAGVLRAATVKAGLSLGDRYCIALAIRLNVPAVTADRNWRDIAHLVPAGVRMIR